jgi:hypothetical protein
MADVNNLLVGVADLWNLTVANLLRHLVEGLNFSLSLNLVERVAMGRVSNAKAVDGQCAVAGCERRVYVAVVVIVVAQIPVTSLFVSSLSKDCSRSVTHVLSKPIPWLKSWIFPLLLSAQQYCAEML